MTLIDKGQSNYQKLSHKDDLVVICCTHRQLYVNVSDVLRLAHVYKEVRFYEIDMDDNEDITMARAVSVAPTFQIYKMGTMVAEFSEPNKLKLSETLRRARKINITPEPYNK